MRKIFALLLLLMLLGCSAQGVDSGSNTDPCVQKCDRYYSNLKDISELLGADLSKPEELICSEPLDCTAKFRIKDTSFDLYYYKNASTEDFYKNFNHEVMHISNCAGPLCEEFNEFHYVGAPRGLEVICKEDFVIITNKHERTNHTIDCDAFKTQNKYNPRTWVCDFNDLVKASCS
jgi:hypothetical protein